MSAELFNDNIQIFIYLFWGGGGGGYICDLNL